jgi:hypothetical protein
MSKSKKLLEAFRDDPLGLLDDKKTKVHVKKMDQSERLIESFQEIIDFFEKNDRLPAPTGVTEFKLHARLEAIKSDREKVQTLIPLDLYDLLGSTDTKTLALEKLIGEDPLGLLDDASVNELFNLRHVKPTGRIKPDKISKRKQCKNFDIYLKQFEKINSELLNRERRLVDFKEGEVQEGRFYVLNGILLYLENLHTNKNEVSFQSGKRNRLDGRTRCIFDNGTESDMLFRSLNKALSLDGFGVSEPQDKLISETISDDDVQNGFIYVLESLSTDRNVRELKHLHKIGYTSGDVASRIKNAINEPTYLMAEVKVVATYRCFNLKTSNLEANIKNFFRKVRLKIELESSSGKVFRPVEWFIVPIEVVNEAIGLLINDEIKNYRYDSEINSIILKELKD